MSGSPSPSLLLGVLVVATMTVVGAKALLLDPPLLGSRREFSPQRNAKIKKDENDEVDQQEISVAFLGNSILYYNDCPRLVEQMLRQSYQNVVQDSCLRGGVNLSQLWIKGNGMRNKFASAAALLQDGSHDIGSPSPESLLKSRDCWNFVVMNDHTQGPAREATRTETVQLLKEKLFPVFQAGKMTPVFLQTFAYKVRRMNGTEDLGDMKEYTKRLMEGYKQYQQALQEMGLKECRIAPVGEAVQWLSNHNNELWQKIYSWDDYHPSPHGTLLEAMIVFCTITRKPPPEYSPSWWQRCRYMQPPNEKPLPLPTHEEALLLQQVACRVCDIE